MEVDFLKQAAQEMKPWLSRTRRDFHMHPELGNKEFRTSRIIQDSLSEFGIDFQTYEDSTAVVGLICGAHEGKTVAIRADMDALPIQEENEVPYRSLTPGVMHACGHDAHTAVLLGTARLFSQYREQLHGNIRLLFQPAEETTGGAEKMVTAGCMKNPDTDYVIGLHVSSHPAGTIEIRKGAVYGASDQIDIRVLGKQAHGAHPDTGVDAIAISAQVVTALQNLVSRKISPVDSAVFTIGKILGGAQRNIIADEVQMEATLRTLYPETRIFAKEQITKIAKGVSAALGGRAEVDIRESYHSLFNTDRVVDVVRGAAAELVGKENLLEDPFPSLGVEDFSYFLDAAPGAFYCLGTTNPSKEITWPAHSSRFDIDEDCLPTGVLLHILTALRLLNGEAEET
ncbi:peptidase M20 [Clostridium sp. W14A]|nr:peptidase M20 [Clostridium sp. W14A]